MNQDVAVSRALNSISNQLAGLTTRQYRIIGNHLYLLYGIGHDNANKEKKTRKSVIRTDSKGNVKRFDSVTEAAKSIGVKKCNVINVCKNRYKQWLGYTFKYEI